MNDTTTYYFMPSMRQGLLPNEKSPAFKEGRPAIAVGLDIKGYGKETNLEKSLDPKLTIPSMYLYGPGDILGFNPRIVVRTDPQPDTGTFEANYFPMIEFADADFVWRYSPVRNYDDDNKTTLTLTDNEGNATPWITLIVLAMETWGATGVTKEFEEQTSPNRDLPPYITVNSIDHLPDLEQAKFWAHVQVTGPEGSEGDIKSRAEQAICRLMCPRRLAPKTKYAAFVVPTFELGRQAGLGLGDNITGIAPDAYAWGGVAIDIKLPYYYRWEFITSEEGDFEYLVRLLDARDLSGLGKREIDCNNPAPDDDGLNGKIKEYLGLEGALQPVGMAPTEWGGDVNQNGVSPLNEFHTILAGKLNEGEKKNDLPLVKPPLYGQWQYDSKALQFLREKEQKEIFLSYDDKEFVPLNKLMGRLQDISGKPIANREIKFNLLNQKMNTGDNGRFSFDINLHSPAISKYVLSLKNDKNKELSFEVQLNKGLIVLAPQDVFNENWYSTLNLDPRHRVAAALGSQVVRKEQESLMSSAWEQLGTNEANQILTLAQSGQAVATRLFKKMQKLPVHTQQILFHALLKKTPKPTAYLDESKSNTPSGKLDPAYMRIIRPGGPISRQQGLLQNHELPETTFNTSAKLEPSRPFGGALRAISDKLAEKSKVAGAEITTHIQPTNYTKDFFSPDKTIKSRILPRLADSSPILQEKIKEQGLKPFAFSPEFPKPLYEELRSLGDQYILPGVEKIPQNTIGLLEVNQRFIEAFLCGCNHEMSKELLWREYPASLGGTYFRQFWDVSEKLMPNIAPTVFFSFLQQKMAAKAKKMGATYNADFVKKEQRQKLQAYMDFPTVEKLTDSELNPLYTEVMAMEAHQEVSYDIKKISDWKGALGENAVSPEEAKLVLAIRGDLLRRYPGTVIYAVDAIMDGKDKLVPNMPTTPNESTLASPVFRASLPPDITFLGFNFSEGDARSDKEKKKLGKFFILEERVGEARFGLDKERKTEVQNEDDFWVNLAWTDFGFSPDNDDKQKEEYGNYLPDLVLPGVGYDDKWNGTSSFNATKTLQKPFRLAIHADDLLGRRV